MTSSQWKPRKSILIPYDPLQYDLYRAGDPACVYHPTRWPLSEGRGRFGGFPLVVVREYFRGQGYAVLASEPRLPNAEGFILVSYPRKRRAADPAYQRMEAIFGSAALAELNASSDAAKVRWGPATPPGETLTCSSLEPTSPTIGSSSRSSTTTN